MLSRRAKNCGRILIPVHTAEESVQSRREGSKKPVIQGSRDISAIHSVSNVILFSYTTAKSQTKKTEVTSKNNSWVKPCLPTDK